MGARCGVHIMSVCFARVVLCCGLAAAVETRAGAVRFLRWLQAADQWGGGRERSCAQGRGGLKGLPAACTPFCAPPLAAHPHVVRWWWWRGWFQAKGLHLLYHRTRAGSHSTVESSMGGVVVGTWICRPVTTPRYCARVPGGRSEAARGSSKQSSQPMPLRDQGRGRPREIFLPGTEAIAGQHWCHGGSAGLPGCWLLVCFLSLSPTRKTLEGGTRTTSSGPVDHVELGSRH